MDRWLFGSSSSSLSVFRCLTYTRVLRSPPVGHQRDGMVGLAPTINALLLTYLYFGSKWADTSLNCICKYNYVTVFRQVGQK